MLQYLLNTTAIWLIGLLFFDLFLRRETYHTYNRVYLVSILLLGALLPLWEWSSDSVIYATGISGQTVEQATILKENIASTANNTINWPTWQQWIWIGYFAGIAFVLLRYVRETIFIIGLYRRGHKTKNGNCTIITTNKEVSPFSISKLIFISNTANYSNEELQMIINHEKQHGKQYHFIDLLVLRLFNMLFWFHPLLYLLEKRLLIVHEYQADAGASNQPHEYGQFLVSQAMLGSAPALSHSFLRSPLKKRILMLTRTTSKLAQIKKLVVVPVMMILLLCCTQQAINNYEAPVKNGTTVTYKGNTIEFNSVDTTGDTVYVEDPSTGDIRMVISQRAPKPILFNSDTVYDRNTIRTPGKFGGDVSTMTNFTGNSLKTYLLTHMDNQLKKFKDGKYQISIGNIIIDKDGGISYWEFGGLNKILDEPVNGSRLGQIEKDVEDEFVSTISVLIATMPNYNPSDIDGEPVYSIKDGVSGYFNIKDGKLVNM